MKKLKILLFIALILISKSNLLSMNIDLIRAIGSGNVENVYSFINDEGEVNIANIWGEPALIVALKISNPNIEIIRLLLGAGADVNIPDNRGKTALTIALNNNDPNLEIIMLLLDAGADINIPNEHGIMPLTMAINIPNVNTELIRTLLDANADVSFVDKFGVTQLTHALSIKNISIDVINVLIDYGANINSIHRVKGSPLMQSLSNPNIEVIEFFINIGADVNAVDGFGGTALIRALEASSINIEKIRLLFQNGADAKVFVKSKKTGLEQTLLMQVLEAQALNALRQVPEISHFNRIINLGPNVPRMDIDTEIIDLLIRAGVDVNYSNQRNRITALMIALDRPNPNIEIIKLLLEAEADVNMSDHCYKTVLSFALDVVGRNSSDTLEIVSLIVKAGVIFDRSYVPFGAGPLIKALDIRNVSEELIRILVDAGANVNKIDVNGRSVLMKASKTLNIDPKIIRILVNAGAMVNQADKNGESALIIASKIVNINPEVIRILVNAGAYVRGLDQDAKSVLMNVVSFSGANPEVVQILVDSGARIYESLLTAVERVNINPKIIKILINAGEDVNQVDLKFRESVLIKALKTPFINPELIDMLISAGARVNTADRYRKSATSIARNVGFIKTDETLISVFFDNCLGVQGAFLRLLKSEIATDISLGSTLKAHKTILAARIPNFNEDILNQSFEGKSEEDILEFLRWIYTGVMESESIVKSFCRDLDLDFESINSEVALKRDICDLYDSIETTGDSTIIIPGHRNIYDIEVEEIRIPVHIDILNARSGLFRDMFRSGISRDQSDKVISDYKEGLGIENVAIEFICNAVIEFIYTGEISYIKYMTPYLLENLKGMDEYFQLNGELDLYLERFFGESRQWSQRRRMRRKVIEQQREEMDAQLRELRRQDGERLRKLQAQDIENQHKLCIQREHQEGQQIKNQSSEKGLIMLLEGEEEEFEKQRQEEFEKQRQEEFEKQRQEEELLRQQQQQQEWLKLHPEEEEIQRQEQRRIIERLLRANKLRKKRKEEIALRAQQLRTEERRRALQRKQQEDEQQQQRREERRKKRQEQHQEERRKQLKKERRKRQRDERLKRLRDQQREREGR